MLVLARHTDEDILIILEDRRVIKIKVIAVYGDRARVGIDAPTTVEIHREEVYSKIVANSKSKTA